ncbi:MAG: ornithine cyclodeaminase/alanine dehydrogenase-like protein (mu-crystallin family) [Maribacter sp.]|jgi:ornithine cyclodeaminase
MPAWHPSKIAGVKIATVSPQNGRFDWPYIQAIYVLTHAVTGAIMATMQAKSLTAKRKEAAPALASFFCLEKIHLLYL